MSESRTLVQSDDSSLPPPTNSPIILQIGERRFVTTAETLSQGSHFFAALLSGRWDNAQADGSYFLDADPALFEHVLRFLRRGLLPIFYDKTKGHDYALYMALLEEARYFQIPPLEKWLMDKGYLRAVNISYSAMELDGSHELCYIMSSDEEQEYHPSWHKTMVYICPRGIPVHRGNENKCGKLCEKAKCDGESNFEEELCLKTVVIRKQTVVNQAACTKREV